MTIGFQDRVVIVTGAGNGLGRCHALEFARRGAKVVVNDFGGARDGTGTSQSPAEAVVAEIVDAGGEAIANAANVTDFDQCTAMAAEAMERWGRIDVLVNNAGILRDKSFAKMDPALWRPVVDVHLNGSANCSMAVWNIMREQNYGRIVMTTSTSGVYGNFGQSNYGAAKMGLVGLMNTLCIEGMRNNIRINCLAPTAATRMTEDVLAPEMLAALDPQFVTPAAVFLSGEDAPNRTVLFAGAGTYSAMQIRESKGIYLDDSERNAEAIAENFDKILDFGEADSFVHGGEHVQKILQNAMLNRKN
ncbi:MAG: SDR family NAD(P)-dependent oxidoreductase [Nitratireductor sp.]|nr:SDR family NAD(P)-dependent oxidoreductase [Nitratireductor sp.]MCC0019524.1 SDR family NAD(P)-dependent oxidoreductase [Nitratireductor sp.]